MYEPDKEKLKKYLHQNGEIKSFDVHAWLHDLSYAEKKHLYNEVMAVESRRDLSPYAVQFYGHFCEQSQDPQLHQIEQKFVSAQLEEKHPEEIAKIEDIYFEYARELMKTQYKFAQEST